MKRRRRWAWSVLLAALWVGAMLAACDASDAPRGGPQLPSTPSFLSGSGSGSPSPSAAQAVAPMMPGFGVPLAPLATLEPGVAKDL
jgi:hypothetical protein